jgi:hypothetical protein
MNPYALEGLKRSPSLIRRLTSKLSESQLKEPTAPDRFSPHEVAAHLALWEAEALTRMRLALKNDCPEVHDWAHSDDEFAEVCAKHTTADFLDLFELNREKTLALLSNIKSDEWGACVRHELNGNMTIHDMAGMQLGHDVYHIDQIAEAAGV